ncbi:MAG: FmdB family zinc ribbon protein [Anaerolineales bacterium]
MDEISLLRWFMPIYTYRCEHCGVQFDRRQKFSDEPLTICPECETETLRKVYLPVGIVFKGSGFYSTDNRSPSGRDSRQVESHSDSTGGSSDKEKKTAKNKEKTKTSEKEG